MPCAPEQDHLDISALASRLHNTIFREQAHIRHFTSIGSTNTVAMQAALQKAPEGSVFIAEEQLAGRGRGGHTWHSEVGQGIYLSVVLRPVMEASCALPLSLIAGLAVYDALKEVCGVEADLRWPNDVLLGGRKLAGILTETSADMKRIHHAVVGFGINVNHASFPPELAAQATSLRIETGHEWPRNELIVALLKSLDRQYLELQGGAEMATRQVIRRFEMRSTFVRGAWVAVHDHDANASQYTGKALGLDERGFLRIQTDSGVRTVLSGGIRKVPAAEDSL